MTLKKKMILSILALMFSTSLNAIAADTESNRKCREDIEKICPNLTMKNGLGKCLRSHKDEFSKECQEKAELRKAEFKIAVKDCKNDVKKVCAGIEHGDGRIIKCLKENTEKLSPACKTHVEKDSTI